MTPTPTKQCVVDAAASTVSVPADIPLTAWLDGHEVTQIPWKIKVGDPKLRMDQRFEVSYSADVPGQGLRWSSGSQSARRAETWFTTP